MTEKTGPLGGMLQHQNLSAYRHCQEPRWNFWLLALYCQASSLCVRLSSPSNGSCQQLKRYIAYIIVLSGSMDYRLSLKRYRLRTEF